MTEISESHVRPAPKTRHQPTLNSAWRNSPVTGYCFWKPSTNDGLPEDASGGHGISVIPGFRDWVLLHPLRGEMPEGSIPVEKVVEFLETVQNAK